MRILCLTSFLFIKLFLLAQNGTITLQNPSFEGIAAEGGITASKLPEGWHDCGFPGETPPDVHPKAGTGAFQVTTKPSHGNTYLGFVVRDNDTWEMVSQKLSSPIKAGVTYAFSIDLCRSPTYLSASRVTNEAVNYATPISLRIWGGNGFCERKELLATSPLIIEAAWKKYDLELKPSEDFQYIVLEAFYKTPTPFPYNGNLLMDNASDITVAQPAIPLTEADRQEFSMPLMGTEFRIVVYHPDNLKVEEAVEKAFKRVAVLEKVFSDYEENSEVSWLSDAGKAQDVSDELWDLMQYSLEVSQRSEGAFDVSVGALTKVWRKAIRQGAFPDQQELNQAFATVGYQHIKMKEKNKSIKLEKEGMRLDFGAIAKGYAVDEAMAWLRKYKIYTALVDGGGDIVLGNAPPGQKGWEVELPEKLENGELSFKKAYLANTAVATSGDTYRFIEHEGKRYSHIIDPRTGLGLTNRRIVTVTAPSCLAADAWATAASVGISKLLTVDLKNDDNVIVKILE